MFWRHPPRHTPALEDPRVVTEQTKEPAMTAASQPRPIDLRHGGSAALPRRIATAIARAPQHLGAAIRAMAASGQLGPNPETEVGRWTGARV
jgi:hypothetical protein